VRSQTFAIDFHVHTAHSFDCWTPPRAAVEIARRRGLAGIAVTDHDTVSGALEAIESNRYGDFLVIPGVEIKSDLGDVIGLYVTRNIVSRVFADVIAEIHEQGGLAYVPHPLRTFRPDEVRSVHAKHREIDLWELYNGRYDDRDFASAEAVLGELGAISTLCGSDAHFPWEIGVFRTLLSGVPRDPQALLALSRNAQLSATPRRELPRRVGITLGSMTKALKQGKYLELGLLLGGLPWKTLRRAMKVALRDRLSSDG
jgi:predicted metal-dependent phosphoesterase TrpH